MLKWQDENIEQYIQIEQTLDDLQKMINELASELGRAQLTRYGSRSDSQPKSQPKQFAPINKKIALIKEEFKQIQPTNIEIFKTRMKLYQPCLTQRLITKTPLSPPTPINRSKEQVIISTPTNTNIAKVRATLSPPTSLNRAKGQATLQPPTPLNIPKAQIVLSPPTSSKHKKQVDSRPPSSQNRNKGDSRNSSTASQQLSTRKLGQAKFHANCVEKENEFLSSKKGTQESTRTKKRDTSCQSGVSEDQIAFKCMSSTYRNTQVKGLKSCQVQDSIIKKQEMPKQAKINMSISKDDSTLKMELNGLFNDTDEEGKQALDIVSRINCRASMDQLNFQFKKTSTMPKTSPKMGYVNPVDTQISQKYLRENLQTKSNLQTKGQDQFMITTSFQNHFQNNQYLITQENHNSDDDILLTQNNFVFSQTPVHQKENVDIILQQKTPCFPITQKYCSKSFVLTSTQSRKRQISPPCMNKAHLPDDETLNTPSDEKHLNEWVDQRLQKKLSAQRSKSSLQLCNLKQRKTKGYFQVKSLNQQQFKEQIKDKNQEKKNQFQKIAR